MKVALLPGRALPPWYWRHHVWLMSAGNQVGAQSAQAIAEALKVNKTLTKLDLRGEWGSSISWLPHCFLTSRQHIIKLKIYFYRFYFICCCNEHGPTAWPGLIPLVSGTGIHSPRPCFQIGQLNCALFLNLMFFIVLVYVI